MMDVILIQPRYRIGRTAMKLARRAPLPQGLLSVATPLDVAGYKVRIIDQATEPDWEASLLAELKTGPVCVGVTSTTGPQIWWALEASRIVKESSQVPVVWGGVHASLLPEQTLESPYIDIVVQGEGEATFLELVETLASSRPLHDVDGIWYKESGRTKQNPPRPFVDLNRQPPLSYHLIDITTHMASMSGRNALRIETSRGCPFDCAFCYNTSFGRKQWRALAPEETLYRITRAVRESGVDTIAFSDDNFFTSPDRAHRILEGMVQQLPGIAWGRGDIRLDMLSRLDDEYLGLIEGSGCLSLVIGVESGCQRIVDMMNKGIDVSEAISVNKRLARYKMQPRYSFLLGVPGETVEDMAETASLMLRLVDENRNATNGTFVFVPYPGTTLFDVSVQHGFPVPRRLEDWARVISSNRRPDHPWLSPEAKKVLWMISFCGTYLKGGRSMHVFSEVPLLVSLIARLYGPAARKRMQGLHYGFMPELRIAELLGFRGY
jgi:radical SAM superfamily enzyme YgiQ (UPF0313 family)